MCLYVKEKMVVKHQGFGLEFQGEYRYKMLVFDDLWMRLENQLFFSRITFPTYNQKRRYC